MITLKKTPGNDFIVLNLTDTQIGDSEWEEGHLSNKILTFTVNELVKKLKPDLITISGDLAWANHYKAYDALADYLDSLQIPWAPVWGNHDNSKGPEVVDKVADSYMQHEYCVYEKGDKILGNGNYVIAVEEDGHVVEGIIMLDTHDRLPYINKSGEEKLEWAKLTPEQLDWYREQVEKLKELGCNDTMMVMHIPIFAYRYAFEEAFNSEYNPREVSIEDSYKGGCWNDGYKDSYGVLHEKGVGIYCFPEDEHAFDVIEELQSTKHVVCGHDHINNFAIKYRGVELIYGLKTGCGCYWDQSLNGGTYFRITSDGVTESWHEYIDATSVIEEHKSKENK